MRRRLGAITASAIALGLGGGASAPSSTDESWAIAAGRLPTGYRDWKLVSVAHEAGNLNDIRAILGNDIAIKAYREGATSFPDGAIIARLAYQYLPSAENNAAFGREQSFVAGPPTNVQFMVKDARRYASTGGWNYVQFNSGRPAGLPAEPCFACHVRVKARDYVFTRYAP